MYSKKKQKNISPLTMRKTFLTILWDWEASKKERSNWIHVKIRSFVWQETTNTGKHIFTEIEKLCISSRWLLEKQLKVCVLVVAVRDAPLDWRFNVWLWRWQYDDKMIHWQSENDQKSENESLRKKWQTRKNISDIYMKYIHIVNMYKNIHKNIFFWICKVLLWCTRRKEKYSKKKWLNWHSQKKRKWLLYLWKDVQTY